MVDIVLNIINTIQFLSHVDKNLWDKTKKIDEKTIQEEKELSKWLNKPESELKIVYGQPDKIEFLETRNRNYIYVSKKFNIKCERKFEINPNNMVIGFSSKNCF